MCSCRCFARTILVIFNLIFLLAGLLMVAIGLVAGVKPGHKSYFFEIEFGLIHVMKPIFIVILGSVVTTVGFFGCFGACGKSRGLLTAYISSLVVVLLVEAALIAYAAYYGAVGGREKILPMLTIRSLSQFKEDLTLFDNGTWKLPRDSTSLFWTQTQIEWNCCGTYNYADYNNRTHNVTINGETHSAAVPISCCSKTRDIDLKNLTIFDDTAFDNLNQCLAGNNTYINPKGCFEIIFAPILDSLYISIGFAAVIVAVEVLLIIVAAVMCHRNRNHKMKVCDASSPDPWISL